MAFSIPILERWLLLKNKNGESDDGDDIPSRNLFTLIIVPTRELAIQVGFISFNFFVRYIVHI